MENYCLHAEAGRTQHFDKLIYILKYLTSYLNRKSTKTLYHLEISCNHFDFSVKTFLLFYSKRKNQSCFSIV